MENSRTLAQQERIVRYVPYVTGTRTLAQNPQRRFSAAAAADTVSHRSLFYCTSRYNIKTVRFV